MGFHKNIYFIFFFFVFVILSVKLQSQNVNLNLENGSYYKIISKDGLSCDGTLIQNDSAEIIINNKNDQNLIIAWKDVKLISDKDNIKIYRSPESIYYKAELEADAKKYKSTICYTNIKCDIYLANEIFLNDVLLYEVSDSIFNVLKDDHTNRYPIKDIQHLRILNHGFWTGFAVGSLATLVATAIAFASIRNGEDGKGYIGVFGTLFAIPVGLIGGAIGGMIAKDSEYSFNSLNPDEKALRLKLIVNGKIK